MYKVAIVEDIAFERKTLFEYLIKGISPKDEAISVPISIILQNNIKFFKEFI